MKSQKCKCGHEKKYHSDAWDNSRHFCNFSDKTENWDIPKQAKDHYLKLGIKELSVCPCKKFQPAKVIKTGPETYSFAEEKKGSHSLDHSSVATDKPEERKAHGMVVSDFHDLESQSSGTSKSSGERACKRCNNIRSFESFPVGEYDNICIYCINEVEI